MPSSSVGGSLLRTLLCGVVRLLDVRPRCSFSDVVTPIGSPVARHHHQPSSVPPPPTTYTTHSGVIEVHNSANGDLLGYIGKNMGNGGAQFVYDPALSNALIVSFKTVQGGPATQTDLDISTTVRSDI